MTTRVDAVASEGTRRSFPVDGRDVAVLGGTVVRWFVVMTLAARSIGLSVWSTSTWRRWDTGLYLSIARDGYVFERFVDVANRGPDDWCWNSGWFPAYPWMMRFGSWLGFDYLAFGRFVSLVAMVGSWVVLWFGFLRRHPLVVGVLGMVVAAMFQAIVVSGPSTLAVGDLRARVLATLVVGGPVAVAYVAVMAIVITAGWVVSCGTATTCRSVCGDCRHVWLPAADPAHTPQRPLSTARSRCWTEA